MSTGAWPGCSSSTRPTGATQTCPHDYGVDDIPVIVQDRASDEDGTLDRRAPGSAPRSGTLGDESLVNGTWDPHLDGHHRAGAAPPAQRLDRARLRLRLRRRPAVPLSAPTAACWPRRARTAIQLSPGERAEIVVEMRARRAGRAARRSPPPRRSARSSRFDGGDDRFDVLQLRAAARPRRRSRGARGASSDLADAGQRRAERTVRPRRPARSTAGRWTWSASTRSSEPGPSRCGRCAATRVPSQLPPPRRAVPGALRRRRRRRRSCAVEGHRVPARQVPVPAGHAVQPTTPTRHAVHVPLPPAAPRGRRDDGPVRRRPARGAPGALAVPTRTTDLRSTPSRSSVPSAARHVAWSPIGGRVAPRRWSGPGHLPILG